jgi:hypothetical protein
LIGAHFCSSLFCRVSRRFCSRNSANCDNNDDISLLPFVTDVVDDAEIASNDEDTAIPPLTPALADGVDGTDGGGDVGNGGGGSNSAATVVGVDSTKITVDMRCHL